ncbi:hypothetical protein GMST_19260 [Geomonas silvestris]|uniref:Glycosyltransferase RgtA/B/C/D-like domain-containing protein n=2 Tax=Geomonas silvestris TaxID=2740184 RepID=A0A6V8MHX2_9BACT|nr:hypothetical protein GMST_19260 [Geomonas silvestris]
MNTAAGQADKALQASMPRWLFILALLGTLAIILARSATTLADPDLWGYLSFGRLFWTQPGFPWHDTFSYLPTKPLWVYHEWLTGVLFYPVYHVAGAAGMQLLKYALVVATVAAVWAAARTRGGAGWAILGSLLLISPHFGFSYSPVRAQVFTYLFFPLTLLILETHRRDGNRRVLWFLAPLFVLWANFHGGFVSGLGIIGIYAAGALLERRDVVPYLQAGVLASLATLVNPYGYHYWTYLADALTMPRPQIDEWQSFTTAIGAGDYHANAVFFLLLAVIALMMLLSARKKSLLDAMVLGVTAYLAFGHVRHQSLFFLAMGVLAPSYVTLGLGEDYFAKKPAAARNWARYLVTLVFAALLVHGCRSFWGAHPFSLVLRSNDSEQNYPVGAVQYLKSKGIKGNILPEFSWGEYLMWELPGQCRVAMDGRYETVYPREVGEAYFAFMEGWTRGNRYLEEYPHTLVLTPPSTPAAWYVAHHGWKKIYGDADCVLFQRPQQ